VSTPEVYEGRGGADTEDDAVYMRGDSPFLCLQVRWTALERCRRVDGTGTGVGVRSSRTLGNAGSGPVVRSSTRRAPSAVGT
jgi:hypothetical protein